MYKVFLVSVGFIFVSSCGFMEENVAQDYQERMFNYERCVKIESNKLLKQSINGYDPGSSYSRFTDAKEYEYRRLRNDFLDRLIEAEVGSICLVHLQDKENSDSN